MRERRRGNEAAFDRHGMTFLLQPREKPGPSGSGCSIEVQHAKPLDGEREPLLQTGAPPAGGQKQDAVFELAKNDGIHREIALVLSKPSHDTGVRHGLGRLTQNIGVRQILHSESGDS